MDMIRYNPWGIGDLQNEINRLFSTWGDNESSSATAGWMPAVDIQEYDSRFQLYVDLPGVDPKEVEITLENGILTLSGERKFPSIMEEEHMENRRIERAQGKFHRRFALPETVDAEKVKASDHNGVLEISIEKQAKALPRRIKVAA